VRPLACLILSAPALAWAADGLPAIDTSVSLRGDAWSGSRGNDDAGAIGQASAWGRAKLDLGAAGKVVGDGWVRAQSGGAADGARLRELYWRYSAGPLEVKLGRQLVVWGRADGINPTDKLAPRDFTLLAADDGEQRHGNEALQVALSGAAGHVSALWFPHAASHTVPLKQMAHVRYALEQPRQSQWALKWEGSGEGVDGSVSYVDGIDPVPDLALGAVGASGVTVNVANHRARTVGADISVGSGKLVWRAEAAWTRTGIAADDFTRKKDQFFAVGGAELSFGAGSTLGVQGTFQKVSRFRDPDSIAAPLLRTVAWEQAALSNQTARVQRGVTLRLASRWLNDTLAAEASAVALWPHAGGLWRTRFSYAIDDHWSAQAGSDRYVGPAQGFLGQLAKNRLVFVQLRYGM
jgi:hypothetical protein